MKSIGSTGFQPVHRNGKMPGHQELFKAVGGFNRQTGCQAEGSLS
jgi:hypothetical protein